MSRVWSNQQNGVFVAFVEGTGNIVVRARAGTGKTTTIVEAVLRYLALYPVKVTVCAFGKDIQLELERRFAGCANVTVKTLHSLGLAAVKRYWPDVTIKFGAEREQALAEKACGATAPDAIKKLVAKLCTKGRLCAPHAKSMGDLTEALYAFECDPDEQWEADGYGAEYVEAKALAAMELAASVKPAFIDGNDMVYLPVRNGWLRKSEDLVVVDECLPGWTPVMLHDGSSMTIQQIVESTDEITVRSYDTITGEIKNCRVVARQKILNQRPLVKIKTQCSRRYVGAACVNNFVVCTVDHKIWTSRGWIEAGAVQVGDLLQIETAAKKTQAGKTTTEGRARLAKSTTGNGTRGGFHPGTREKFNAIKGGNGRGPTLSETALLDALGDGWTWNHTIPTGKNQMSGEGWPSNYKVDLAHPDKKIAVEVDGKSHKSPAQQELDKKKTGMLESLGWKVFRVWNKQAIQHATEEACRIVGGCPAPATVVSVDLVEIRDNYVYDITVEECHNFYANGILVHNCQDMNPCQLLIAQGICKGRLVVVGDDRQAIFAFAGADEGSLDRLKAAYSATEMPLNTTYRCARSIVREAQAFVPDFEAGPENPEGLVETIGADLLTAQAGPGDFVLSRVNAPLVSVAMGLLRAGKRTKVAGRDIGKGLIMLTNKLRATSVPDFLRKVEGWRKVEEQRLRSKFTGRLDSPTFTQRLEGINDQADMLQSLADAAKNVQEIVTRIEHLFTDDGLGDKGLIVCSSVHKAKGKEADRVFVLKNTLRPGAGVEEDNICYVAITRAKHALTYVVSA